MTNDELKLLEELAPKDPVIYVDFSRRECCYHCGVILPKWNSELYGTYEVHANDCPWVAARKLIQESSPNGD